MFRCTDTNDAKPHAAYMRDYRARASAEKKQQWSKSASERRRLRRSRELQEKRRRENEAKSEEAKLRRLRHTESQARYRKKRKQNTKRETQVSCAESITTAHGQCSVQCETLVADHKFDTNQ